METNHGLKVGDQLAFNMGFYGWRIETIERITPTGHIVAGCYTLDPDLSIRGRTSMTGPYRGEIVTPRILEDFERQKAISLVGNADWKMVDTESLVAIAALTKDALTKKEPSEC
jgi:hypothetical protein